MFQNRGRLHSCDCVVLRVGAVRHSVMLVLCCEEFLAKGALRVIARYFQVGVFYDGCIRCMPDKFLPNYLII